MRKWYKSLVVLPGVVLLVSAVFVGGTRVAIQSYAPTWYLHRLADDNDIVEALSAWVDENQDKFSTMDTIPGGGGPGVSINSNFNWDLLAFCSTSRSVRLLQTSDGSCRAVYFGVNGGRGLLILTKGASGFPGYIDRKCIVYRNGRAAVYSTASMLHGD